MKCKHCNGTGKVRGYFYEKTGVNKWEKVWGDSPCDECNGTGKIQQTNEEWRKTCSTREFAEFLSNLAYSCMRCGMSNGEGYCHTGYCIQDKEDALLWLKQPHRERNNHEAD